MAAAPGHQSDIAANDHMRDTEAWNDNVEKTVDLLWDTLVTHLGVNVPHLLVYLHIREVDKIVLHLHELDRQQKNKEAAEALLTAIKKSDEPDKWRVFMNALKQVSEEDSILLHYLLNTESTDEWLDHPEHRRLINAMKECLYDHLNIKRLLQKMIQKGLISKEHALKIAAKVKTEEKGYAQLELIAAMQSHKVNWYRKFITILYEDDDDHRRLAMELDPEFCKEKLEQLQQAKEKKGEKSAREQATGNSSADGRHQEDHSASTSRSGTGGEEDDPEQGVSAEDQPQDSGYLAGPGSETADEGEMGVPALYHTEASCQCRCCARLGVEVSSLRSTVLSLRSEISEIKQLLLLERGQSSSQ